MDLRLVLKMGCLASFRFRKYSGLSHVEYQRWRNAPVRKAKQQLDMVSGPGGSAFWRMFWGIFLGERNFPGNIGTLDQICQVGQTNPIAVNLAAAPGSSAADGNSKSLSDARHGTEAEFGGRLLWKVPRSLGGFCARDVILIV